MEWADDLVRELRRYEGSWAGLINLFGLIAVIGLTPSVGLAERAMRAFLLLVEGSRKYRAAKTGRAYNPVVRDRREPPERFGRLKNFVLVFGTAILCIVVIAVVEEYT